MWKGILVVGAAVALAVAGISCSDHVMNPTPKADQPGTEYLPPANPESVLENLQTAYEAKDIDAYAACLHPEFVFIPSGSNRVSANTLDRDQDLRSTGRMFDRVDEIRITLTHSPSTPSALGSPYSEESGHRMIDVSNVSIRIVDPGSPNDGPIVHQVNGDQARFIFRPIDGTVPIEYQIVCQQEF